MAITDLILEKIKEEIDKDPQKLGYAGKTDEEIATILSSNVIRQVTTTEVGQPPLNRILSNISEGPNIISKEEVLTAKSKI
jgi:hypothetical protein